MKLLQLNVTANWGSTGKIAEGIGQAAMARSWESYIAYGRMMNPSQSQLIKVGNKFDVYAHYARNRFLDGEGLGSRKATKELISKIRDLSPDIIHLHNIHDHWLNYPHLFEFLRSINIPVVWTFHDCWAFTGGCAYFDLVDCNKWETGCFACPQKGLIDRSSKTFAERLEYFASLEKRLTIVPVSNWLMDYCKRSVLSGANITAIHNGVDVNIFKPISSKAEKPTILGVALPWSTRKGLDDIIKLRSMIPKDIVDIVLVGLNQKQIDSLPPGIDGLHKTQNTCELAKLYSSAMIFVNPTHSDNFPTVNLEALACGTPVVTYRTGGSPEAVDASTGIVVDKGDVQGLADAVMTVLDNPILYPSEACRSRAVNNFNKDVQFNKYIDLYESLI